MTKIIIFSKFDTNFELIFEDVKLQDCPGAVKDSKLSGYMDI